MPFRCGTFPKAQPQTYAAPKGDRFGANVAEHELMLATLAMDPQLRWDIWWNGFAPSFTKQSVSASQTQAPVSSANDISQKIAIRPFQDFEATVAGGRYVFVVALPLFPQICAIRRHFPGLRLPVCAILHSVWGNDSALTFPLTAAGLQTYDSIITTSSAGRRALEAILAAVLPKDTEHLAAIENQIVDLSLGTHVPDESCLDQRRARDLLKIPLDCFAVLYLGRLSEEYKADLDIFLESFAGLTRGPIDCRLLLAGQCLDSGYAAHIRRRLSGLNIDGRSLILENFPEVLKSSIYSACDVFVSPADSIQETFGLSIIEAMAHARPVVASDWSGYRDIVVHEETGFLLRTIWSPANAAAVSPFAAVMTAAQVSHYLAQRTLVDIEDLSSRLAILRDNPELARRMGYNARERVIAHYSWPAAARGFINLWQDQIERAKGHHRHVRKFVDFNEFFSHYATQRLSEEDIVFRSEIVDVSRSLVCQDWTCSGEAQVDMLETVLDTVGRAPTTIAELTNNGASLDCILWLAKKGICRIVRDTHPPSRR